MAGFSQGGGVGLALANWMVDGDPGFDVWAMDVARFGDWASPAYTHAKVRENYSRRFRIRFPNEELPAARPLRTTPVYERLKARGAVFGAAYGLEHALWFAPPGMEPREDVTYRRSNAHGPVGDECRAVRQAVGLLEIATFARYEVAGPGAGAWLDRLLANRLPREGRIALSPMLNEQGQADRRFHRRECGRRPLLRLRLRHRRAVSPALVRRASAGYGCGDPLARRRMDGLRHRRTALARAPRAACTRMTSPHEAIPFLALREMKIAGLAARVGADLVHRRARLRDLGRGRRPGRAVRRARRPRAAISVSSISVRARSTRCGSRRASATGRANIGRSTRPPKPASSASSISTSRISSAAPPWRRDRETGPARRLVTFVVDAADADAIGDEPVWQDGKVVGWVTSGGYGHCVGASIALGYVPDRVGDFRDAFRNRDSRRAAGGDARVGAALRPGGRAGCGGRRPVGARRREVVIEEKKCRCTLSVGTGGPCRRFASAHRHECIVGRDRGAHCTDWSSGKRRGRTVAPGGWNASGPRDGIAPLRLSQAGLARTGLSQYVPPSACICIHPGKPPG